MRRVSVDGRKGPLLLIALEAHSVHPTAVCWKEKAKEGSEREEGRDG
jgi:hypothetical protein